MAFRAGHTGAHVHPVALGAAVVLSVLFGRTWATLGVVLATCSVLVALLGLNISVIGLITIPTGSLYRVAELFGLIVALAASFAAVFLALPWRQPGARPLDCAL